MARPILVDANVLIDLLTGDVPRYRTCFSNLPLIVPPGS